MKYIKYIVILIFLTTLNCNVKKPVESKKEEFTVGPGEKVALFKSRHEDELIVVNESDDAVTFYIKALGPVWNKDYASVDSMKEDEITVPVDTNKGWDHDAVAPAGPPYFGYAIYEIGVGGGL